MSMMECGHCKRTADARSMMSCDGCGQMVCNDCSAEGAECPGDEGYEER